MASQHQRLTRSRIFATALQLIAQDGVTRFSMRKLARQLGVEAMALYKHVANKTALLDGLVILLLEEIVVPKEGHWTTRMRGMAHSYRRLALAYPYLFQFLVSRPLPAEARPILEEMWEALADAGLAEDRRMVAFRTVSSYVAGFALSEIVWHTPARAGETEPPPWSSGDQQNDRLFQQGLDAILAGLLAPQNGSTCG